VVTRTTKIMPTSISGTLNYLAPEAYDLTGFYTEVDIWAMACLIVAMCTGSHPWAGLQVQQIMNAVLMTRAAPAVPDHAPEAALLRRCVAFDPKDRPSASELVAAFEPEAAELPEVVGGMAASFARQIAQLTSEKDAVTRALEASQRELTTTSRAGEAALRQSTDALEAAQRELATTSRAQKAALRQSKTALEAAQREAIAAKDELRVSKAELKSNRDRQLAERRELEKENQRLAGLQRGSMASAAAAPVSRKAPSAGRATAPPAAPVARAPRGAIFRVENCHNQGANGNYTTDGKFDGKPRYRNDNNCRIECGSGSGGSRLWAGMGLGFLHLDKHADRPPCTGWLKSNSSPSPLVLVYL
jgi:hypothetical protein